MTDKFYRIIALTKYLSCESIKIESSLFFLLNSIGIHHKDQGLNFHVAGFRRLHREMAAEPDLIPNCIQAAIAPDTDVGSSKQEFT